MMTRAELVERLQTERFLPLPPAPKPSLTVELPLGLPHDTPQDQYRRRTELREALKAAERGEPDNTPLVKKGLLYIPEAAA